MGGGEERTRVRRRLSTPEGMALSSPLLVRAAPFSGLGWLGDEKGLRAVGHSKFPSILPWP